VSPILRRAPPDVGVEVLPGTFETLAHFQHWRFCVRRRGVWIIIELSGTWIGIFACSLPPLLMLLALFE